MSTWQVITRGDLQRCLVDATLKATLEAALGEGQSEPFLDTMHERANYVRARISGRCRLSATPYAIPPELMQCAALLIVEQLVVRLSIAIAMTDDQVRMINRAYSDLQIAGTSALPISTADDSETPAVESGEGGVSIVRKPSRVDTRDHYQGL